MDFQNLEEYVGSINVPLVSKLRFDTVESELSDGQVRMVFAILEKNKVIANIGRMVSGNIKLDLEIIIKTILNG